MPAEGSISWWIGEIKRGNAAGAEVIFDRYFPHLVQIARQKLRSLPGRMADEEDVALSVLDSFCRAAPRGCFPELEDREGLWRLLFHKTIHKAVDLARHERRKVRGGGRVHDEAVFNRSASDTGERGLAQVPDDLAPPEFAAMMAEQCRALLNCLEPDLQSLALARLEGYSNEEIAQRVRRSVRTVERRLQLIRRKWEKEISP